MAEKFKTGDIVELNSGSPQMTVAGFDKRTGTPRPDVYKCQWFGGKKLEEGYFPEESLQLAKGSDANTK